MPSVISAGTTAGTAIAIAGDTTGNLAFQTNGTTTAMTIDTSQNVGVGTTSPTQRLTVAGSTSLGTAASSGNTSIFQAPGSLYLTLNTNGTLGGSRRNWSISPEYNVAGGLSFISSSTEGGSPVTGQMIITSAGLLQFNSGYGSVATAYGCRAWVNFNGMGTVAIRASGNVSSITDNGTGDYTVNFTTAMPDNSYSVAGSAKYGEGSAPSAMRVMSISGASATVSSVMATTFLRVTTTYVNGGLEDCDVVCVSIFR